MLKAAIIGGAPSTQDIIPPDDYEVWVHGNQFDRHENRRVDKIFEIHDDLSEHDPIYPKWIADKKIPMIVGEKFPIKGKHIEVFPFDDANKIMGEHLTSTPAYMMAYALLQGATHINIYGVDMGVDDNEYFYQRPTMYAWIGYAKAKGIEIYIPPASSLFVDKHVEGKDSGGKPDYRLKPFTEAGFLEMAEGHGQKINKLQSQISQIETVIHTHNGSKQSYLQMARLARAVESGQDIDSISGQTVLK